MDIGRFGGSGRGVSSVIGTILMVAVTVILAAAVGQFVLASVDTGEEKPLTSWGMTYEAGDSPTDDVMTIYLDGGEPVAGEHLSVVVDGAEIPASDISGLDGEVSPGGEFVVTDSGNGVDDFGPGDGVFIVWNSGSGDGGAVLARFTL